MEAEPTLGAGACFFLLVIAICADVTKIGLDFLFGIGVVLDPLFITPITTFVFWIVFNHNGVRMFNGPYSKSTWVNEIISFIPGIDVLPDWTTYAIYLSVSSSRMRRMQNRGAEPSYEAA